MGWYDAWKRTESLLRERGVVRPRDPIAAGIPPVWLYDFKHLEMRQVGPALFIKHDRWRKEPVDPLLLLACRYPRATLGALSALWAHGLIERPAHHWLVIGIHDRKPKAQFTNERFLRSSWPREDREDVRAPCGVVAPTHSVQRAVLDCVRYQRRLGEASVEAAVEAVFRQQPCDREALEERARQLHVLGPLRQLLRRLAH